MCVPQQKIDGRGAAWDASFLCAPALVHARVKQDNLRRRRLGVLNPELSDWMALCLREPEQPTVSVCQDSHACEWVGVTPDSLHHT